MSTARTKVFVSYSHEDRDWLKRISMHLAVLERKGVLELWSDQRIVVGVEWEKEIERALSEAKVAVLLVLEANRVLAEESPQHG